MFPTTRLARSARLKHGLYAPGFALNKWHFFRGKLEVVATSDFMDPNSDVAVSNGYPLTGVTGPQPRLRATPGWKGPRRASRSPATLLSLRIILACRLRQ